MRALRKVRIISIGADWATLPLHSLCTLYTDWVELVSTTASQLDQLENSIRLRIDHSSALLAIKDSPAEEAFLTRTA